MHCSTGGGGDHPRNSITGTLAGTRSRIGAQEAGFGGTCGFGKRQRGARRRICTARLLAANNLKVVSPYKCLSVVWIVDNRHFGIPAIPLCIVWSVNGRPNGGTRYHHAWYARRHMKEWIAVLRANCSLD